MSRFLHRAATSPLCPESSNQMPERNVKRLVQGTCIVLGTIGGAFLPFLTHEAASPRFTDIEARIGFGAVSVLINAAFGALAGWAIAAILTYFLTYFIRERE